MHASRTRVDGDLVILIVAIVPEDSPLSGGCGAVLAGGEVDLAPGHREIVVWVGAACCYVEMIPQ